jgi:hypothetical protein
MGTTRLERAAPLFVSYSRRDMDHFYLVKRTKLGSLIWFDTRDIAIGDPNWRRRIESAIRESCGVVVLCSPNSKESDVVTTEIELAQSLNKEIFPVWIDGENWGLSAPFSLITYNALDFRAKDAAGKEALDRIADAVVIYLKKSRN